MKNKWILEVLIVFMILFGCADKKSQKYFAQAELYLFEISGNGSRLDFPIFSKTISIFEIEQTVVNAEEIHDQLSNLYEFKHFKMLTSGKWEGLIDESKNINSNSPIFEKYVMDKNKFDVEIIFSSIIDGTGEFIFRFKRNDNYKGVQYQKVFLKSGETASIGALYQEDGNKGLLYVLSYKALEISPEISKKDVIQFYYNNDTITQAPADDPHKNGEKWADVITGESTYEEAFKLALSQDMVQPGSNGPKVKFIPYDKPPKPLASIRPQYPVSAQIDSISGTVVIQAFIESTGLVNKTIILRGVRDDLDNAAIQAILAIKFKPALQKGVPVGVWISIPINFKLTD